MSQPLGLFLPYLLPFVSPRTPSAPLRRRPPRHGAPGHPRSRRAPRTGGRFFLGSPEEGAGGGRRGGGGGDNFHLRLYSVHTHPHTHTFSHSFFSFCRNLGGGSPPRETWREPLHAPGGSFCPLSVSPSCSPLPTGSGAAGMLRAPLRPALPGSARSRRRARAPAERGKLVPAKLQNDPWWARSAPHRLLLAL